MKNTDKANPEISPIVVCPLDKQRPMILNPNFKSIAIQFLTKDNEVKNYVLRRTARDKLILV